MMEKAYNVTSIKFEADNLILTVDGQVITLSLAEVSGKLARATSQAREDYTVSPSGYGIHWRLLDEDLSINGLLKKAQSTKEEHHHVL